MNFVEGFATPEGTQTSLFSGPLASRRREFWKGGPKISYLGFGSYRIGLHPSLGYPQCADALELAISKGMNLIDTSTNYGDGQSELLIGRILKKLIEKGSLKRENCVIVSKVGYIQGSNHELARARQSAGRPFQEITYFNDDVWHCIHPEFIRDQCERSRSRLGLNTVDVYLLHNPEYMLGFFQDQGFRVEKAREIFYQRIKESFLCLEDLVKEGKIRAYGISSNSFGHPDDDPTSVSLERCIEIAEGISAEHSFKVVQAPLNWIELGAGLWPKGKKQVSTSVLASQKGMGFMVNRPLNASFNKGLIRLARPPEHTAEEIAQLTDANMRGLENWAQLADDLETIGKQKIDAPGYEDAPLSQLVLGTLMYLPGVTCVLVGARKTAYVEDVEQAASLPVLTRAKDIVFGIFESLDFHRD